MQGGTTTKRNPTFGGHFEILPGVIYLFLYIFVKNRYFNVSGKTKWWKTMQEYVCYAYLNKIDDMSPCPRIRLTTGRNV